VERDLLKKAKTRGERRSVALLHLAVARCRAIQGAPKESVLGALAAFEEELREVDSDLTLYSLAVRSNVVAGAALGPRCEAT
jgi:hypothetical protein